jgi:two-component system phosphate regulon sensor histidine kinase PhoR
MFDTKNLSTRKLSVYSGLILGAITAIAVFLLEKNWTDTVVASCLVFISAYLLISVILERFIYRKIKLIYKFIYQTKASKKEEVYYKYLLPTKTIDEVREEVEAWAEENEKEIELLRRNEQFRKEFLQNLSHEFKTPIFAIQGYVDTLLHGAIDNPDVNKKFLEKASKNVERMTNLISDLDEISRLERGEMIIYKQNFVMQDLVKEVFDSLSLKAEQQQIKSSIKKGCEAPLTVFADKEKIRQVLSNLIENSVKYGKPNGNIVASMYKTDGKHILVEISDDGVGIPEKHLPRIFERFYRTDEGRSRDVTGSGLGLSICKHIIEAHGQSIHVRSTEGVGTTVGFTLESKRD